MARKPRDYAAEYARRTLGAPRGSYARQVARGHKELAGAEHRVRAARARAAGRLTETELRFVRQQLAKTPTFRLGAAQLPDRPRMRHAQATFEAMTPAEREAIMAQQHRMAARYRGHQRELARRAREKIRVGERQAPYGGEYSDDEWDVPDLDDDDKVLMFYH